MTTPTNQKADNSMTEYDDFNAEGERIAGFKFASIGILLAFIVIQGLWLSKHIQTDTNENS